MKVSFVIPSYNCVVWLPHAVTSCLEQTHKDIEVIIVNDGSTDRTHEYLTWLHKNESRAKILNPGKNAGRSLARRLGNDYAQGEIICVLDADDIATPNRAELTVRRFKNGKPVDYVYGPATEINALGMPIRVLGADSFDREKALKPPYHNKIVHSTAAYTKAFAMRFPYRSEFDALGLDDWAQQIEANLAGAKFDFLTQKLACYRYLESAVTKIRDEKQVIAAKEKFISGLLQPA